MAKYRIIQTGVDKFIIEKEIIKYDPRNEKYQEWDNIFSSNSLKEAERYIGQLKEQSQFPKLINEYNF